jgi:hypothetical protein
MNLATLRGERLFSSFMITSEAMLRLFRLLDMMENIVILSP